jgi:transcriptional repressor NrdR
LIALFRGLNEIFKKRKKREVTSEEVGELVMKHLSHFDTVAYIRFASIYRAFESAEKFQSEIRSLKKDKKK